MEKKCSNCKEVKSTTEFYKDRSKNDGFRKQCKKCYNNKHVLSKNPKKLLTEEERVESKKEACKKWRSKNKSKFVGYSRKWKKENKDKVALQKKRYRQKKENDPLFKVKRSVRRRLWKIISSNGFLKNKNTEAIIGCTWTELKKYLEEKFVEDMSWDNYGEWHIDHIIPLAAAESEEDIYRLNHYTNLQPLWAIDNLKKGSKIG